MRFPSSRFDHSQIPARHQVLYYIEISLIADLFLVDLSYILDEALHCILFYDADGTAAEACSGHTGTNHTVLFPCSINQGIQLFPVTS